MPTDPDHGLEAAAIQNAYEDRIRLLFEGLATNLGETAVTHMTEKQCVERFSRGLTSARRARGLALAAIIAGNPIS